MASSTSWTKTGWSIQEAAIDLTTADVDLSVDITAVAGPYKISYAMIRYSAARSETIRLVVKPVGQAANDVYIDSTSLVAGQRYMYTEDSDMIFEPGDVVQLTATRNTATGTAYAKLVIRQVTR